MARKQRRPRELKNIGYEIFVCALSILSIVNHILLTLLRQDTNLQYVVLIMNAFFMPSRGESPTSTPFWVCPMPTHPLYDAS